MVIVFIVLWVFLGGRQYEFVGLKPLFSHEPLPDDPFTINPFIINHLKGKFNGSIVKDKKEEIKEDPYNEKTKSFDTSSYITKIKSSDVPHINRITYHEEPVYHEEDNSNPKGQELCSYDSFVQNKDGNNILPHIEQSKINPIKDKKRISELLHMNMSSNLKSKWKYQNVCCKTLEDIYKKPFTSSRPTWLKNPETGGILEIDCYNDELKIGVEYNGIQHYKYPNVFHKTYDEFIKQVRRDQYKHKKCDEHGVYLITVPYNVPQEKIRDYIIHYLPENVSRRLEESRENKSHSDSDVVNVPTMTTYQEYLA